MVKEEVSRKGAKSAKEDSKRVLCLLFALFAPLRETLLLGDPRE
jgi:hypothetical protein